MQLILNNLSSLRKEFKIHRVAVTYYNHGMLETKEFVGQLVQI